MTGPHAPAAGRGTAAPNCPGQGTQGASAEHELIRASGLFDTAWYLESYPDIATAGADPLPHFADWGWHEGRCPNLYFDTPWYLRHNPDVARAGMNPLLHYIRLGEAENRSPCAHFDLPCYRARHPEGGVEGREAARCWRTSLSGATADRSRRSPSSTPPGICRATLTSPRPALIRSSTTCSGAGEKAATPPPGFDTNFYVRRYLDPGAEREPAVALPPSAPCSPAAHAPPARGVRRARDGAPLHPPWAPHSRKCVCICRPPRPGAPPCWPTTCRSSIRSPKTTSGGARASPNGRRHRGGAPLPRPLPAAGAARPRPLHLRGPACCAPRLRSRGAAPAASFSIITGSAAAGCWKRPLNPICSPTLTIDLPFCINWANEDWTSHLGRALRGEVLLSQRYSP